MRSTKKVTAKDAGWDPRLDSLTPSLKRSARRNLNHKLRQQQKLELRNIPEVCVCCGAPLYGAELNTKMCNECRCGER